MKKRTKRILIAIVSIIMVIAIAGGLVGNYFYNLALNPKTDKSVVFNAPHNQEEGQEEENQEEAWFDSIGYEEVYLKSRDNLNLHAYEIKNEIPTDKWVVIVHGYVSEAANMKEFAKNFYELGFHILMPDCRGHGKSEGNYIGMGWPDRLDIISWIDQIIEKQSNSQILLFGVSMGGATVMMTSGEELPSNVKAVVEDCGYTSVKEEFAYQLKQIFGLPSFPILNFASAVTYFRAGYTLGEASAIKQVAKSKTPTLFIHGDADTFVPFSMLEEVYQACSAPKEKYIVQGAGHGDASKIAGKEYWNKVENFIASYIE